MATILDFRAFGRSGQSRSGPLRSGCEIVLFPGVRYEYNVAPPAPEVVAVAKPKRKSSSRKRDKLELKD